MKRNLVLALLTLATLSRIGTAFAQTYGVRATVPFEFTVGGRLLPSGTYTITSPMAGVVQIQGTNPHLVALTTTFQSNRQSKAGSKLVFDKYGSQYFLHGVVCPTVAGINVDIPASNLEKRVQIEQARADGKEQVYLAAR